MQWHGQLRYLTWCFILSAVLIHGDAVPCSGKIPHMVLHSLCCTHPKGWTHLQCYSQVRWSIRKMSIANYKYQHFPALSLKDNKYNCLVYTCLQCTSGCQNSIANNNIYCDSGKYEKSLLKFWDRHEYCWFLGSRCTIFGNPIVISPFAHVTGYSWHFTWFSPFFCRIFMGFCWNPVKFL